MQRARLGLWMSVVTAVAILATLTACSGGGDASSDVSAGSTGAGADQRFISLGTAPAGGAFFVVGGAIGETLNDHRGDRPWQVTAEATKGSQENIRRLDSGEIDLALANSAISYFAVRGSEGWDKPYAIRTVMTLAPNVAFFISPRSSGVKSVNDLAGKRVVIGPAGAGFHYFVRPLVAAHGLDYDSMEVLHGPQTAAVDMLADGSAAAAFLGGAVPTASITQASTSQDIFFVPIEADAVASLTEQYVFFRPATIPAGTYRGQDEDYAGLDVGSMHLITSADKNEELVYELTKTIYENRDSVTARHPAGRAINPNNVVRDTGTEFHPGAIRYYREIGIWPEDAEAE